MMETISTNMQQPLVKKKRSYMRNKVGLAQKRVTCTVCLKPGCVWYYENKKHNSIIYEHRDEPPIKDYEYRGQKYKRYRRCHTGVFKENPMDSILSKEQMMTPMTPPPPIDNITNNTEPDWQTMYFEMKSKADAMHRLLQGADEIWES